MPHGKYTGSRLYNS